MSQRFHQRPSGRTIRVDPTSPDDEGSGRPCGAVGAALPLWWPLDGGGREASAVRLRQTVGMTDQQSAQDKPPDPDGDSGRIVVVTPDGMGVSTPNSTGGDSSDKDSGSPADLVEQPAKVMRIGSMIKNLLDEVRNAPLDDAGRARLAEIHRRSLEELEAGLAPELVDELERITLPLTSASPSDAELRIAQAQLVGWLEGLFHGIQTALFAQQMAAQQQLQGMRRALPPGHPAAQDPRLQVPGQVPGQPPNASGTGQYL